MRNCVHNAYDSLHKRYLKETIEPTQKLDMVLVYRIVEHLSQQIRKHVKPFDAAGFLLAKKGKLRARYGDAYKALGKRGFNLSRDSEIKAFIKNERYYEEGKSARSIMGRDPKFNILYAQIIEVVEKAFFQLPNVCNACDYFKSGAKLSGLLGSFLGESDQSKFEAHQREEMLWLEFLVYYLVLPEQCEMLLQLFSTKMVKKGAYNFEREQIRLKFDFLYCRGSGDMDTSLGNGVLNYIMTMYFLIKNFCPNCPIVDCAQPGCCTSAFVLKGDDNYFKATSNVVIDTFAHFGFDTKMKIHTRPEELEFCSGHFLEYQPGKFYYVQKLRKLLSSLQTCINPDIVRNGWVAHYYYSLGMMYKQLYAGVPVYEDIADFLLRTNSPSGLNLNLIQSYNLIDAFSNSSPVRLERNISLCYVSMSMINHISIGELLALQRWLRSSRLELPKSQTKRCRIATKPLRVAPVVDFPLLNAQLLQQDLPSDAQKCKQRLSGRLRSYLNTPGQCG